MQLPYYVTKTLFLITSRAFSLGPKLLSGARFLLLQGSLVLISLLMQDSLAHALSVSIYTTFLEQQLLKHFIFLLCRSFCRRALWCSRSSFLHSLKLSLSLDWCLSRCLFTWFCCCVHAASEIFHGTYFSFCQHLLIY